MDTFAIFCKTYIGDLPRFVNLYESIRQHNVEKIPFYVSVPASDYSTFEQMLDPQISTLLKDESICDQLVTTSVPNYFTPGYLNQQIIKLTFWKTGLCKNYFCVDSDAYFIRDFFYHDFMFDEETPLSVLVEDKELCIDPEYQNFWNPRQKSLNVIKNTLGYDEKLTKTCHGNTTLSKLVLESFEQQFMLENNYSYSDLLYISPYEFSWYNFWLQKEKPIKIESVEPLIKVFHYQNQYLESRAKGITEKDIARGYLGIILNSNWNSDPKNFRYQDPKRKKTNYYLLFSSKVNRAMKKLKKAFTK